MSEYNRLSAVGFGADGLGLLARDNLDALDPQICTAWPTFLHASRDPSHKGHRQTVQLRKGSAPGAG